MKTSPKFFLSSVLTALFMMTSLVSFSQKNNTWVGGAPGMENDWFCAKNWSAYSVPDEYTNVFIPDVSTTTLATPVIENGHIEVNALFMETDALLTVKEGVRFVVFGFAEGLNENNLDMEGNMFIIDEASETATAIASVDESR